MVNEMFVVIRRKPSKVSPRLISQEQELIYQEEIDSLNMNPYTVFLLGGRS